MEIGILILITLAALLMELIDAGLGMGYGTVLSPLLISLGYDPMIVIPSILFSQAIGGLTASFFHHRFKNVDFKPKSTNITTIWRSLKEKGFAKSFKEGLTMDTKIALSITVLGIIATIIGAFAAIKIPGWLLKTYIGALITIIGIILLSRKLFNFSWKKMMGLGLLASFNKGISGGGFGPVATGGQVIAGNKHKSSIGCTTLSEAPICLASFMVYVLLKGITDYNLITSLSIGALAGAPLGALLTKKINPEKLKCILGILITLLGIYMLLQLGTA